MMITIMVFTILITLILFGIYGVLDNLLKVAKALFEEKRVTNEMKLAEMKLFTGEDKR